MKAFVRSLTVAATAGALLSAAGVAQASIVASSLPYSGTPDWTDFTGGGASMTAGAAASTLTTADGTGVWFGWGPSYLYGNQPAWTPSDSTVGNYFAYTASFSPGAKDWNTYLYDDAYLANIEFAPSDCNCYGQPPYLGVRLGFDDGSGGYLGQQVALDLSQSHTFEVLLKGGQVSYRIDGTAYSGAAYHSSPGFKLLVIGDGSGSTPTGRGSMTLGALSFDNAPTQNVLLTTVSAVPEPASWGLMIAGLGMLGAALRRRTNVAA